MNNKSSVKNRKIRSSKHGYTLIELVVTIAILSITASMGVGIFASAMRNYSTASVTAQEQAKALQLESYITSSAKVAKKLNYIKFDASASDTDEWGSTAAAQGGNVTGAYLICPGSSTTLKTYNCTYDETSHTLNAQTMLSYESVKQVNFQIRLQRVDETINDDKSFIFLDYEIIMERGYTLSGSVIMNNCSIYDEFGLGGGYIENGDSFTLGNTNTETGIIFVR